MKLSEDGETIMLTAKVIGGMIPQAWKNPNPLIPLIYRIDLDEMTGCWNWRGGTVGNGYGSATYEGKTVYAHRLSAHLWLRFDLKSKLNVLHRCDNPRCFNPKHLFIGTQKDNLQDCLRKGRNHLARRTHCPKGHEFTPENTYRTPSLPNRRTCRKCWRERYDRIRAKK